MPFPVTAGHVTALQWIRSNIRGTKNMISTRLGSALLLSVTIVVGASACSDGSSRAGDGVGGSSASSDTASSGGSTGSSVGSSSSSTTASGGSSSVAGSSSMGGSSGVAGSSSVGGGSSAGSSSSAGGRSSSATSTKSGGTSGTGGTSGVGGSTGRGGASSAGGATGGGGGSGTGGASSKGGSTGTAGSAGTTRSGGTTGTGGTTGSGGSSATGLGKFSFFVTSLAALRKLSGSQNGFGGDLRYGQADGLAGADKICTEIAELSMTGSSAKVWHAFLSTSKVNAIDRVGTGPWYDRLGRIVANTTANLQASRPVGAEATIINDLPNENGVLNHNPDKTGNVDNHDMLTGTDDKGKLYGATATCSDWTSTATTGSKPRVGHTWPTMANGCSTTDTRTISGTGGSSGGGGGGWPGGGGFGAGSMCNWMSALDEAGCAPGVNLVQTGGPGNDGTVGSGGGYGGFYCFALTP